MLKDRLRSERSIRRFSIETYLRLDIGIFHTFLFFLLVKLFIVDSKLILKEFFWFLQ